MKHPSDARINKSAEVHKVLGQSYFSGGLVLVMDIVSLIPQNTSGNVSSIKIFGILYRSSKSCRCIERISKNTHIKCQSKKIKQVGENRLLSVNLKIKQIIQGLHMVRGTRCPACGV